MAKRKIILTQYATGSWTDNIGDTTLFYTGESSVHSKDIDDVFMDNPPKLSPDCATVIWRYYADVDRYLLVHVQGSQVVNQALGRNYPFRAAYEVRRSDLNSIKTNIPAIIKAIPRIETIKGGRLPLETIVDDAVTWPIGLKNLKTNIEHALFSGQRLYIELDVAGKPYRGDGIFAAPELSILLGSIGMLDEEVIRYVSFGFCADYIAEPLLDEVLVVVYQKGREMRIPSNAIHTTWAKATAESLVTADYPKVKFRLPGASEPLLPLNKLYKAMNVDRKGINQLQSEDWEIWLNIGHKLTELPVTGWTDFAGFYHRMSGGIQHVFRNTFLGTSVNWSLDGLTPDGFRLMAVTDPQTGEPAYSQQQIELIQAKALRHYILDDGRYDFLFPNDTLSDNLRHCLVSPGFIKSLEPKSKEDVEHLFGRYVELELSDKQVQELFLPHFKALALPELQTLTSVMAYMREYPFIPSSSYDRQPQIDIVPREKELQGLSDPKRVLINQWIEAEVKKQSVTDIEEFLDLLNAISTKDKKADPLKLRFLQSLEPDSLYAALREAQDGKSACEQLLSYSVALPKEWNHFAQYTIVPAVDKRLFGNSEHPECLFQYDFSDISEWGRICTDYASNYPYIFKLITHRFKSFITEAGAEKLADDIRQYFSPKGETLPAKNEIIFDINPPKKNPSRGKRKNKTLQAPSLLNVEEANTAYPLIKILLKSMNSNNPKAQELKNLFSELKAVKKAKKRKYVLLLIFITGLILGAILASCIILGLKDVCSQSPAANNLYVNQGEHPMVAIANCSEEKKIDTVFVDDAKFTELIPDSMESLQTFSDKYYAQCGGYDCFKHATVFLSRDSIRDSMTIAANNPLLKIANLDSFRVDSIKVDSVLIDLNPAAITGYTSDPNYYLQVIKAISKQIPDSLKNQIAY